MPLREPSFEEYKDELLFMSADDLTGVYEAWWLANGYYPDKIPQ